MNRPKAPRTPSLRDRGEAARRAATATWGVDPITTVTAYDEIWFQGRPSLP